LFLLFFGRFAGTVTVVWNRGATGPGVPVCLANVSKKGEVQRRARERWVRGALTISLSTCTANWSKNSSLVNCITIFLSEC